MASGYISGTRFDFHDEDESYINGNRTNSSEEYSGYISGDRNSYYDIYKGYTYGYQIENNSSLRKRNGRKKQRFVTAVCVKVRKFLDIFKKKLIVFIKVQQKKIRKKYLKKGRRSS